MHFATFVTLLLGATRVTSTPLLRKEASSKQSEKVTTVVEECQDYFEALDQDHSGAISLGDVEIIANTLSEDKTAELMDAIAQMLHATGVTSIQDDFHLARDDYVYFCAEADNDMEAAIEKPAEIKSEVAKRAPAESNKKQQHTGAELKMHLAMEKRAELNKELINELQLPTCAAECGEGAYCGSGGCQDNGSCRRLLDCFQPDNLYPVPFCLGQMECDNGSCTMDCGAQPSYPLPPTTSCLAECGEEQYCGSDGGCQDMGTCNTLDDCSNPYNLFAIVLCIGDMECNEGLCGMNCASDVEPTQPIPSCIAECGEDSYCGSSGCQDNGSCGTLADCYHPENLFPMPRCVGDLECNAGQCFMNCDAEPDVEEPLLPTPSCDAECGEGQYCGTSGCQEHGTCDMLHDCFNPENIFPMVMCVGEMECTEGLCGMTCDPTLPALPSQPVPSCFAECGEGQYCGSSGCQDYGTCGAVDDCFHPENLFPMVMCVGEMECNAGNCSMNCGVEGPPALPSCMAECGEEEYCGSGGCQEYGTCRTVDDCFHPENIFPMVMCVGEMECNAGNCSMNCGVEAPPALPSCMAECGEEEYCGSGGCQDYGTCGTVDDCFHPENLFPMPRCVGEMECNAGNCSVNCGVEAPPAVALPSCMAQCGEDQYCGSSGCQDYGTCGSVDDCFHPENLFPMVLCVGEMECNAGNCSMNCGAPPAVALPSCMAECEEGQYCGSSGCQDYGTCGSVDDCFHPENIFPMVMCVGEMECNAGNCSMNCGVEEPPSAVALPSCMAECGEGQYCGSSGCQDYGSCGTVDDCFHPENDFMVILCMGEMECNAGLCAMNCGVDEPPPVALPSCMAECGEGQYCGSSGCQDYGTCGTLADCAHPENVFATILCAGQMECNAGNCTMNCGVEAPPATLPSCTAADCGEGQFCGSDGCQDYGTCAIVDDCFLPENLFAMILCVGEVQCNAGQCGMICDEELNNKLQHKIKYHDKQLQEGITCEVYFQTIDASNDGIVTYDEFTGYLTNELQVVGADYDDMVNSFGTPDTAYTEDEFCT